MAVCTFAGHRQILGAISSAQLDAALESVFNAYPDDTGFTFYTGGMGEFDNMCASAVRQSKQTHPNLKIELLLVLPYMIVSVNTATDFFTTNYDRIVLPMELDGAHPKSAIKQRNRWVIDQSDIILAFVFRSFGGAYAALKYAQSHSHISIKNLADSQAV